MRISVGERVTRPLGYEVNADKPNRLLHLDYFTLEKGYIYVLRLKYGLSSHVRLVPCPAADDALTTVETLIAWFC